MGEFADMAVDQALNGNYWFPDDEMDDEDSDWAPYAGRCRKPTAKTCNMCKETGLFWGRNQETGKWQLEEYDPFFDEFVKHSCKFKGRWKNANTI